MDSYFYVREANYHPDGGQVVCPVNESPFVILLSKGSEEGGRIQTDDVQPTDFQAYYCDGTFGLQIMPAVWHQPIIPLEPTAANPP